MMSEFKGTKGPWVATVRNNNDLMSQFYGVLIGTVCVDVPTENPRYDSLLAAQAPKLLEALQYAERVLSQYVDSNHDVYSVIDAAIAKALGETK